MENPSDIDNLTWKDICYRLIGRSLRHKKYKEVFPKGLLKKHEELVLDAFEVMKQKCLRDKEFCCFWVDDYDEEFDAEFNATEMGTPIPFPSYLKEFEEGEKHE